MQRHYTAILPLALCEKLAKAGIMLQEIPTYADALDALLEKGITIIIDKNQSNIKGIYLQGGVISEEEAWPRKGMMNNFDDWHKAMDWCLDKAAERLIERKQNKS